MSGPHIQSKHPTSGHRGHSALRSWTGVLLTLALLLVAACSGIGEPASERTVKVGFFAFYPPISNSADPEPGADGFDTHVGYEADLLTAIEALDGLGLRFERQGISYWNDIWLAPATSEFDLVCGGITILESRTVDAAGDRVVAFTDGHIDYRQSLLVRTADAERLPDHTALLATDVVGVLPNTTGEEWLLQRLRVADSGGRLAEGTSVETGNGVVIVESGGQSAITAAGASPELAGRTRLVPADPTLPQVLYLGDEQGTPVTEEALVSALRDGRIDALARGAIDNHQAAQASDGGFAVTALDEPPERGGCVVDADDTELLDLLNEAINALTNSGRVGFPHWLANPEVFTERALRCSIVRSETDTVVHCSGVPGAG